MEQETQQEGTISRRQALKVLAAAGGAIAASTMIPNRWGKPVVEAGILPAHAQQLSPTPTITITFFDCLARDVQTGQGQTYPDGILETWSYISPIHTDILLQRTVRLNGESGTVLLETTGYADATGLFHPPDIDVFAQLGLLNGGDVLYIVWETDDPEIESNTCINTVLILSPS